MFSAKHSLARLLIAAISIVSMAGMAFPYMTDAAVYIPSNYYTFLPPPAGSTYVDSSFGTTVKRISNALSTKSSLTNGNLLQVTGEYSTMSPFNADNSRLIVQHDSYFGLYDGSGNYLNDLPFAINAGSEPRWSRTDTNVLYFINNNQLKQYDISTQVSSVVHTFSGYSLISGKGESDISVDGDHFALAGDGTFVFVYEISTDTQGPVFDASGHSFDSLYITPNNNVVVGYYQPGTARYNGIELFDRNMNFQRQLARAIGHMDVARDVNGDEVLLWTNSGDPQPVCDNGIVKIRVADASQTCLISLDWSLAVHISAPDNNGWVFVETYAPADPDPTGGWPKYTNEILQVKLDGSEVRRLVHHRSRPFDSYYYQPRASTSHDGSKLVYNSNFGLQQILGYPSLYVDAYLIDLGPSAPVPAPAPTPSPTPTATRFEETNGAVVLSGDWAANNMASHSGGSAVLSMTAGSRATFSFNGTDVSWIAYRDEWSGIARIYMDGTVVGQIDTYASPASAQAGMYSINNLSPGIHSLVVEVTGTQSVSSGGAWVWVDAFEAYATAPAPAPTPAPTPVSSLVRYEQTNSSVVLSGDWATNNTAAHSGGTAVLSMTAGSRATFSFNGAGANWIAYRDEWSGIARVYVDGALLGQVDTYIASTATQAVAYSVTGLVSGIHTLVVEVTGTRGSSSGGAWVWVDAFEATNAAAGTGTLPAPTIAPAPTTTVRLEQDDPSVTYSGSWASNGLSTASGASAVLAVASGSRATLTFSGIAVSWIGYRDEWSGIATVTLDGQIVANVDTYQSPSRSQDVTYSLTNLSAGLHTLVVEVTGTQNSSSGGAWIWIDAFDVTR